jgi:hypothetical protein
MPKMSKDKPKSAKRDTLVKTTRKGEIELSESDLKKVAGGLKISPFKGD